MPYNSEQVKRKLRILYYTLFGITLILIILLEIFQKQLGYPYPIGAKFWQLLIALLPTILGLLLPIWLNIITYRKSLEHKYTWADIYKYEVKIILISWITFLFAPLVYMFEVNLWVRYWVTFVGILAL
jgi:hypothetical protein